MIYEQAYSADSSWCPEGPEVRQQPQWTIGASAGPARALQPLPGGGGTAKPGVPGQVKCPAFNDGQWRFFTISDDKYHLV